MTSSLRHTRVQTAERNAAYLKAKMIETSKLIAIAEHRKASLAAMCDAVMTQ